MAGGGRRALAEDALPNTRLPQCPGRQSGGGWLVSHRILGRRSALINVGGQKVHPAEVVSALMELPEVADAAVYGRPDPITGHSVAARIQPATGAPDSAREWKRLLRRELRGKLAAWKIPATVELTDGTEVNHRMKRA